MTKLLLVGQTLQLDNTQVPVHKLVELDAAVVVRVQHLQRRLGVLNTQPDAELTR
jgi:hypothetical protein